MQLVIDLTKTYLLAVSGGIDSMAMAHWVLQNKIQHGIAHCNFGLRGKESDEDETWVRNWCEQHQIKFHTVQFDTTSYARENKLSIQESARKLRYDFFIKLAGEYHYDLIATAHNKNDNLETLLFHFFRGTGIKGLRGIPFQNRNIVRPMLAISREEIMTYVKHNNIAFREDSSNAKDDYTRNKIRHHVLPMLNEIFLGLEQNLSQNIQRFVEVNTIYEARIISLTKKLMEQRGKEFFIPIRKLRKEQAIHTITFELIKPFGFRYEQSEELLKMIDSQSGVFIENDTYRIIKDRDFFIITQKESRSSNFILIHEEEKEVEFDNRILILKKEPASVQIKNDAFIACIDAEQLEYPLILRKWKQGDYFYPLGMNKKKKVARLLIDLKLSLPEKETVWVIESNKKIVWVLGIRIDHRYRIQEKTTSVLKIELRS